MNTLELKPFPVPTHDRQMCIGCTVKQFEALPDAQRYTLCLKSGFSIPNVIESGKFIDLYLLDGFVRLQDAYQITEKSSWVQFSDDPYNKLYPLFCGDLKKGQKVLKWWGDVPNERGDKHSSFAIVNGKKAKLIAELMVFDDDGKPLAVFGNDSIVGFEYAE